MTPGEEYHVLGNFLKIHFTENPGAAFGVTLRNIIPFVTDESAKAALSIFSVLAVGVIFYFLHKAIRYGNRLPYYLALMLGGAIGNIIDRVFYGVWFSALNDYEGGLGHGRVVDMIYFDIWQGMIPEWIPFWGGEYYAFWPIFNIADAAISAGIIAIFIYQKTLFPENTQTQKLPVEPAAIE